MAFITITAVLEENRAVDTHNNVIGLLFSLQKLKNYN